MLDVRVDTAAVERILARMQGRIARPNDLIQVVVMLVERYAKPPTPVRTGHLRRSVRGRVLSPTTGEVGTDVPYAPFVHDGTRFMAGRPFLTDGLNAALPTINALVQRWGREVTDG